jgi:hypothetical protein
MLAHMNAANVKQFARKENRMDTFKLLINGALVDGAGALDVINPATGRALTAAPLS